MERVSRKRFVSLACQWHREYVPLGAGQVLTFREKVLANWPAEMSHSTYGECDFDAQRTDETQDPQQPAG